MYEFGIEECFDAAIFERTIGLGIRPCIVFIGEKWHQDDKLEKLANLFVDVFGGETLEKVDLKGIEHVMAFTAESDDTIHIGVYAIDKKKSGTKRPRVELDDMGPFMKLKLRRTQINDIADDKLHVKFEQKLKKQPKNVERNDLGDKLGRVHMEKQNFAQLNLKF